MEPAPKKDRKVDPQRALMAVLVAAIVLSVGVIGYVLYERGQAQEAEDLTAIASGDSVTMHYIGKFADGRVFDTSKLDVAWDDVYYPKSLTFTRRSNESYAPFTMTAGMYGPGGTIKGFALGVLGMYPGQSKTIEVSVDEGYTLDPNRLVTYDVCQEIPATEQITEGQFRGYFSTEPIPLRVVPHYLWGWNVRIITVSDGMVTFKHEPIVGQMVTPFGSPDSSSNPSGWYVQVEAFDPAANGGEGLVTARHLITHSDVLYRKGVNPDGNTFILWAFDDANQTFQIHVSDDTTGYNAEVSGRQLFFDVTILLVRSA